MTTKKSRSGSAQKGQKTRSHYSASKRRNDDKKKNTKKQQTEKTRKGEDGPQYCHLYVTVEHEKGQPLPVTLEMLGEGRRLMDEFNKRYKASEKVVAIVLGHNVRPLCDKLIEYGADAVIYSDSPSLEIPKNPIDTKVISQIARDKEPVKEFSPETYENFCKPRYMFFAADSIGRHLSSTVMAELESGLASDINKLEINDIVLTHQQKTQGKPFKYEKTLEMYRPDFSGFLWTTILCLDNKNPDFQRDYHPQACSIIPGVFAPIEQDQTRKGTVLDYSPLIEEADLNYKIIDRRTVKSAIDFDSYDVVISFGKGIKDDPEGNIKLVEKLASVLGAQIGVSLPLSKKPYVVNETLSSTYFNPDRVIGTSGRKVAPKLYIAIGISGAMQHLAGMTESEFVIAINNDENAPIKNESDVFIKGRMEDTIPNLIEQIEKNRPIVKV